MTKSVLKIAAIVTPLAAAALAFSYPEFVSRFYGSLSLAAALLICAAAIMIPRYVASNDRIRVRSIFESVITSLVGAWCVISFAAIEAAMWEGRYPGSVAPREADRLFLIHAAIILILAGMALHVVQPKYRRSLLFSLGSLSASVLMVVAFMRTMPRAGDEYFMVWTILLPVFILAAGALAAVAVLSFINSLQHRSNTSERIECSES